MKKNKVLIQSIAAQKAEKEKKEESYGSVFLLVQTLGCLGRFHCGSFSHSSTMKTEAEIFHLQIFNLNWKNTFSIGFQRETNTIENASFIFSSE